MRTTQVEGIRRREIWERDSGLCHICGEPVSFECMELDHVRPLSKGGTHTKDNVATSHGPCNRKKWAHWKPG